MSAPTGPSPDTTWSELFFGKNRLRSNPLQIARAFLPLSNQGYLVNPTIVSAVNTANAGWVVISNPAPRQAFSENKANDISALLTKRDEDYWEISAATRDASNTYFWYVAGTNNQQNGSSYIVTLVLEGASRGKALQIGQKLLGYLKEY
jgi:membrane peptidoglycan carboxypeptidase